MDWGVWQESADIPRTKLNWIPFPSCCEASPARPRRGSSSPLLSVAGFSCGIPVAEDMMRNRVSKLVVNVRSEDEEEEGNVDYK